MKGELVDITFTTSLGAVYKFPDMDAEEVENFLRVVAVDQSRQASLVNATGACLVLPMRVVVAVDVNGVRRWEKT